MRKVRKLSDRDIDILNAYLARVKGGDVPNVETLDGFFAALVCCPALIMPSEYMEYIQCGETEEDDLVFETLKEAQSFTELITRQWNHVNYQLSTEKLFLPLLLDDEDGSANTEGWAKGFLLGVSLRPEIWAEIFEDEERGGPMIPILALAYENDPDPEMRAFTEPLNPEQREELIVGAAAGVMMFYEYFYDQRQFYQPQMRQPVVKSHKVGRNEPCPCGSGKKYKKCCSHFSAEQTIH